MLLWEAAATTGKLPKARPRVVIQPISTRLRSMQLPDRCKAITRVGRHCRCRRASGSEFCAFHDPELSARIRERARAKRDARKREKEALPEGYLKTLTHVDGIASALDRLFREVRQGVVSPRTAAILLAIVDRLLENDRLVHTHGHRRVTRKKRAIEVRNELHGVLDALKASGPVSGKLAAKPQSTRQKAI